MSEMTAIEEMLKNVVQLGLRKRDMPRLDQARKELAALMLCREEVRSHTIDDSNCSACIANRAATEAGL